MYKGSENPCMFCRRGEWVWGVCLSESVQQEDGSGWVRTEEGTQKGTLLTAT